LKGGLLFPLPAAVNVRDHLKLRVVEFGGVYWHVYATVTTTVTGSPVRQLPLNVSTMEPVPVLPGAVHE
jgi:hypothetical protein